MAARKPVVFKIPENAERGYCRSCQAPIFWLVMPSSGKRMPVEAEGDKRGESHFAHCFAAPDWRRPR